jgi:hypothetical protein
MNFGDQREPILRDVEDRQKLPATPREIKDDGLANKRAPGKGGIPSLLTVGCARPALPEHERSAARVP